MMRRGRGNNAAPVSLFAFQDVMTSIMGILLMLTLMMALERSGSMRGAPEATPTTETVEALLGRKKELEERMRRVRAEVRASDETPFSKILSRRAELERLYTKIEALNGQIMRAYAAVADRLDANSETAAMLRDVNLAAQEVERLSGELRGARDRRRMTYIISKQYPKKAIIVEIAGGEWHVLFEPESNDSIALAAADQGRALSLLMSQMKEYPPDQYFVVVVVKPSGMQTYARVDEALAGAGYDRGLEPLPEHWTTAAPSTDIGEER